MAPKSPVAGAQRALTELTTTLKKNFLEAATNVDALSVKLNKSNAALVANKKESDALASSLIDLSQKNAELGFTIKQTGDLYADLSKKLASRVRPGFDRFSKSLVYQTALWERLGVDMGVSIDLTNKYDTALGKTNKQTEEAKRRFAAFAIATKQGPNEVFGDLNSSLETFMHIVGSREMESKMLLFQGRAKSMGMGISEMMSGLEVFETMEGAQRAGAQLNTVITGLGGSFDAAHAQSIDYAERQEYIAKTIQDVMPRILAAGPMASRKYMKALAQNDAIGGVANLRKYMNFKPGQMEMEGQLKAGILPTGVTSYHLRQMGKRATTIGEAKAGAFDAAKNMLVTKPAKAFGMTGPEVIGNLKEVLAQNLAQSIIHQMDQVGDKLAASIDSQVKKMGLVSTFKSFVSSMSDQAAKANTKRALTTARKLTGP